MKSYRGRSGVIIIINNLSLVESNDINSESRDAQNNYYNIRKIAGVVGRRDNVLPRVTTSTTPRQTGQGMSDAKLYCMRPAVPSRRPVISAAADFRAWRVKKNFQTRPGRTRPVVSRESLLRTRHPYPRAPPSGRRLGEYNNTGSTCPPRRGRPTADHNYIRQRCICRRDVQERSRRSAVKLFN